MKDRTLIIGLWISAALAVLIGVGMTVGSGQILADAAGRLTQRGEELSQLRRIEDDLAQYTACYEAFEQLERKQTVPLDVVLRLQKGLQKPEDTRPFQEDIFGGWVLRRSELSFNDASLAGLMAFVNAAESQRPPWRMARCVIKSSARAPGSGQAVVVLECLEKREEHADSRGSP